MANWYAYDPSTIVKHAVGQFNDSIYNNTYEIICKHLKNPKITEWYWYLYLVPLPENAKKYLIWKLYKKNLLNN